MDLKKLILPGESETLEFKASLRLKDEIGESVSSFSNSKGGIVLIGVSDKREIKGVQIGQKTVMDLAEYIKRNTDPRIFPEIKTSKIDNKSVIAIQVGPADEKPVFFKSYAYKRVGDTNQRISSSEIRRLAKESTKKVYWDEQICEEAALEDIDEEKIQWFMRKAREERNLEVELKISVEEILQKLDLLKENKPTNAAILMFGKRPQRDFIQSEVRCARFKGTKAIKPFIDMKVIGGSVYVQIDQAEKFVLFNIRKAAWVEPGKIERQEKWEYPLDAVREAITNAIAHRDYNSSANVHISIFDDRIEVWNPGKLPPSLTPDDLKREHKSIPANPLLANLLFLMKYIERWGTGTSDIVKQCIEHGLPEPVFEEVAGGFAVILRKFRISENLESIELNERQKKVIEYLKVHKDITRKIYVEINNISPRQANKDLNDLLKKKLIRKQGKGRAIFYSLK